MARALWLAALPPMFMPDIAKAASGVDIATPAAVRVLAPCRLPELPQARCGVVVVPEDPARPGGRSLPIHVLVVPASKGLRQTDPIVPLMGGPGEDAISAAAHFARQFAALRGDRDLLLVDQRGTGRSGALDCRLYSRAQPQASLRDLFPPAAVAACARRLQQRADLGQYGFARFADDLERVRRALGYGTLNLYAGSYGTRAAQVYLRAWPHSVRTVYLGSVVPLDVVTPLTMAGTAQAALEATFAACAAEAACHAAFPRLREEFAQVIARLDAGLARVELPGADGVQVLDRGRVVEWFRSRLYRPSSATELPWMIHRAHAGDWKPIAEGVLASARGLDSALSLGVFFAITCNDDIAYLQQADVAARTRGTFLGDYRVRQQQAACRYWPPAAPVAVDARVPLRSAVPTLFVSGDSDGGTPLWFTRRVAGGFANRAELVLPHRGHTEWEACVARQYQRLVHEGSVAGIDAAACAGLARPPFRTR